VLRYGGDVLLQWGRGVMPRKTRALFKKVIWLSMPMLQWGRGVMPRKTVFAAQTPQRPPELQWGRGVMPRKTS